MSFDALIDKPDATIEEIAALLDGLDHAGRMAELAFTTRAQQRRLWELAAASPPVDASFFVPEGVPDRVEVIHHGRNTLPAFKSFQKRFARIPGSSDLQGYNEGLTRPLIGPGYYVAHPTAGNPVWEGRGAFVVDYFLEPAPGTQPPGWPPVRGKDADLQFFVYRHTRDFMRRVSAHVSVGMAFKNESSLESWFTLIRED